MNFVFIDAAPLRAVVTPRDQWSTRTRELMRLLSRLNYPLVTTDYVLSEVFTGLLDVKGAQHVRIARLNVYIFEKNSATIEWITKERFYKTKKLFLKVARDKLWSFTDCTSYVVMKELGIKTAFTFDEHFRQMGFKLLTEEKF